MKTKITKQETISLDKIEKNTNQILEKINRIRLNFFESNFKFSKEAEEEKQGLIKHIFPKSMLSLETALDTFTKVSEHPNFLKLEKADKDFILKLEKIGFKNSHYVKEINDFISTTENIEDSFSMLLEENIYFTLLNSELNAIEIRLSNLK